MIAGVPEKEIGKRVRAALDQVGLLGREHDRPIELSTGEQQRVGIARAVISKPALLIADEPTGNLDPELAVEIMKLFKRFNDVGVTVLIASHDVHLIERFRVRRVMIEGGRVAGRRSRAHAAIDAGELTCGSGSSGTLQTHGRLAGPALAAALRGAAHDPRDRHRARAARPACTRWCRTSARRAAAGATRSTSRCT